jgi:hypothetical protein
MASHHLVEDTFNAESAGPDIQAHDLCPSISLPTFLTEASGVQFHPPGCAFALVVPTPAGVNQRKREPSGERGHMPESRRKKSARAHRFRDFDAREVSLYGNLGPRPRSVTLETLFVASVTNRPRGLIEARGGRLRRRVQLVVDTGLVPPTDLR